MQQIWKVCILLGRDSHWFLWACWLVSWPESKQNHWHTSPEVWWQWSSQERGKKVFKLQHRCLTNRGYIMSYTCHCMNTNCVALPLVTSVSRWGKLRCRSEISWLLVWCTCTGKPPGTKSIKGNKIQKDQSSVFANKFSHFYAIWISISILSKLA